MHLGVAVQAVGEHRSGALIMEGGEVSMALQAVLLTVRLLEQAAVAAAVREVADHTAVTAAGLVSIDEGSPVLPVALHASVFAELAIMKSAARAMGIVTVGAEHLPLADRVMVGLTKLCRHLLMTVLAVLLRILADAAAVGGWRVAGQAGHFSPVMAAGGGMLSRCLVAGQAGGLLLICRAAMQ